MNISEIERNTIESFCETVPCDLYYVNASGRTFLERKTRIFPVLPEMEKATNVILFHDYNSDMVKAGQIGGYNNNDGLYLYLFSIDNNNNVKIDRRM